MNFHQKMRGSVSGRTPGATVDAVAERSTGVDERVAAIFRAMRAGLGVSAPELARMVGTTPGVIETLESGRVRSFPVWPETVRLVSELGRLHRVDARPILARIRDQVGPAGLGHVPKQGRNSIEKHPLLRIRDRAKSAMPQQHSWREGTQRARRRVRRAARAVLTISAPVVLIGGLVWLAQAQPALILGAVNVLPESAARFVRPAAEYLIVRMAPQREGMRWIEVGDPRLRKSDKLRQASR